MQYVYLLEEIDFDGVSPTRLYKIGQTSVDVESRKRQYKAGNARRVDILYTIQVTDSQTVEAELHRLLISFRLNHGGGDEWFYFGEEDINSVIALMNEYAEAPAYSTPSYSEGYSYRTSHDSHSYSSDLSSGFANTAIGLLIVLGFLFGGFVLNQSSEAPSARIELPTNNVEAYLRSDPSFGDNIMSDAKTGERVTVKTGEQVTAYEISSDGQWRRVKLLDGRSGWVASNFVK